MSLCGRLLYFIYPFFYNGGMRILGSLKCRFFDVRDLGLLACSALLFVLSFPNAFSADGYGWLAYVTLAPLWWCCYRLTALKAFCYGPVYGFFTYMAFNYWLKEFDPEAFVLVPVLYAGHMLLLFPAFRLTVKLFPRRAHLLLPLVWLCYEVLRTKGFAGYAYGQMGSSQYLYPALLGVADIGGQLLVSALVIFPSSTCVWLFLQRASWAKWWRAGTVYLLIFAFTVGYSWLKRVDYSAAPTRKVVLLQHNVNSWLQSANIYSRAFGRLRRQTGEAARMGADLIVWSETSFVPSYEYLLKYTPVGRGKDLELALQLQELLRTVPAEFLIGVNEKDPEEDAYYNTVMWVKDGEIVDRYRKFRLVPLSENIPFRKRWPSFARFLQNLMQADPYDGAKELKLMRGDEGSPYAVLICFEDTFPMLARDLVNRGAEMLINVTNDSWSRAEANTNQHFSSALLRAVENRRFLLRAANSGVTAVVDPNGRVLDRLEVNTEGLLSYDVPLMSGKKTLFTRWGGAMEWLLLAGTLIAFLLKGRAYRKRR